jgi:hypothetical protein
LGGGAGLVDDLLEAIRDIVGEGVATDEELDEVGKLLTWRIRKERGKTREEWRVRRRRKGVRRIPVAGFPEIWKGFANANKVSWKDTKSLKKTELSGLLHNFEDSVWTGGGGA